MHWESSVEGASGNRLAKGVSQLQLRSIGSHVQRRHAANYSVQRRHSTKLTTPANERVNGSDDPCKVCYVRQHQITCWKCKKKGHYSYECQNEHEADAKKQNSAQPQMVRKPQQGRFIEGCSDSDKGVCHCSRLDSFVSDFFCGLFVCLGLVFFVRTVLGSQQGGVLEILACAARRSVRCLWHVSSAYGQYIFHTPPSDCRTQLAPCH